MDLETLTTLLDPETLITTFGLLGVFGIVFAETGLLVGFFLPGDSLLFVTGLLVSQGILDAPLVVVLAGCFIAAVVGDQVGYAFGRRAGPHLFRRPDSRWFRQEHVAKAQAYFERYGARTIVLARFIPVVRTFAPVVAGVGTMPYRTFVTYNIVGALLWGVGVTSLGYALGQQFPHMERYLLPAVLLIVSASLVPVVVELRRARARSAR
ncbi:MAG: VTT domain-containing protein [Actinomycetota bacterium]|nr:VTT domain-containing protein [Actinomycetota bacterium]